MQMTNERRFLVVVPYLDLAEQTAHAEALVVIAPEYWDAVNQVRVALKNRVFHNDLFSSGSDEGDALESNTEAVWAFEIHEIPHDRVLTVAQLKDYRKGMLLRALEVASSRPNV